MTTENKSDADSRMKTLEPVKSARMNIAVALRGMRKDNKKLAMLVFKKMVKARKELEREVFMGNFTKFTNLR